MINEDFSIKTGIQVDGGVEQLKVLADALTNIAKSLDKFKNSKVNIDTSGLKSIQKDIDKTKRQISELSNLLGKKTSNANNKNTLSSMENISNNVFNSLDPEIYNKINISLESAASAAERIKAALGGNIQSGLLTQINEMLAKKDELQNLANILAANQKALDRAGRSAGINKNAISLEAYSKNYKQWQEEGIKSIKNEYSGSDIVGAKISRTSSGLVKLSASIRTAEGEWQKYNATVTETGRLTNPSLQGMTNKSAASAEKAFQDIKAGTFDPKNFLNFDEMERYSAQISKIFNEVYGETEKYTAQVDAMGRVSISKVFPDGKEVNTLTARYNDVKSIIENYKNSMGDVESIKKMIESTFTSASYTNANGKSVNTSSSKTTTPKYVTDKSYVSDYKALAKNEAEFQILNQYRQNTTELRAAVVERENILNRVNTISPQNAAETNAKNAYNATVNTVQQNISKYSTQFSNAFSDLDSIKNAKSQVEGISASFAAGEQKVKSWATSVASGKMTIAEFSKNVEGLKTSLNSIYKVITPGINRETGIASLKSMFTELSGNAKDLVFNPDTSKINNAGEEIVKMSASFKDASGNAKTLTGQVNLATGEVIKLGESTKPLQSGFDKFFGGWKNKVNQLAQFLTSFYALRQAWRVLKEGISIIREFDTALAEMRKVSTESVSSIKNFQKQSFDLADKVGSTALQIQNSTADFLRVGESFKDAQQSAVNANKLLTISEFDNIDDATSALVSLKSAYTDLSEDELINRVNAVGDNFAISTDEVATGLQKAGATLSLLGNSIDESAALITAANTTLQNVDTVAAGVRTISLRIMGTEEAKKELEELGEDTSDYVVETIAKKRQIIKDYTAVASNGGKGIDILDENGNNRNMFNVMKDIGAIYDEIQEEDKKYQTNRAQALIEELAGTNYSFSPIIQKCIISTYLIAGNALCFTPQ